MEASLGPIIAGLVSKILPEFASWLQKEGRKRFEGLERDVNSIRDELQLIDAAILDHRSDSSSSSNSHKVWISQVRRLANDIEDWIDQFQVAETKKARQELAEQVLGFKQRSENIGKDPPAPTTNSNNSPQLGSKAARKTACRLDVAGEVGHPLPAAHGGDEGSLEELRELVVWRSDCQSERKLRVICIVGFGGIGKTSLAHKLYTSVSNQFPRHAWVNATNKRADQVLKAILEQLGKQADKGKGIDGASTSSKIPQPENADLKSCLRTKRYLIIIDDVQRREVLRSIIHEFPEDIEDSRIIVTTTVQSVAYDISSDSRHMYKVKTLSCDDPKELFFQVASMEKSPEPDKNQALSAIDSCDGLPLALVSIAEFMKRKRVTDNTDLAKQKVIARICEEALQACRDCDDRCKDEPRIGNGGCAAAAEACCDCDLSGRMQRVLFNSYHSLKNDGATIQYCLLYFSMFLVRRLMAEGLVQQDGVSTDPVNVAVKNLGVLIDRNVIQTIDENAKRCQTPGMMHEYISHKSMRKSFMRVLPCHHQHQQQPGKNEYIRRLTLHNYNGRKISAPSHLRTLAPKLKSDGIVDIGLDLKFANYKLLGVLDLEECDGLKNGHLQEICDTPLLLLKYLSLGGSITAVPRKIARLKCLQTLDLRRSKANTVEAPVEVILLPELKHLLGAFRLSRFDFLVKGLEKKLSKSELETLAGFDIGKSRGISRLLIHMGMLRKIKIWCESTADKANLTRVSRAIKKFIRNVHNTPADLSLSIDMAPGCRTEFLDFLQAAPGLGVLEYLKLVEDNLGDLVIEPGPDYESESDTESEAGSESESEHEHQSKSVYFPSLKRICLVSSKALPGITIQPGALKHVASIHLFSPQLPDPSKIGITNLKTLKEIALQKGVDKERVTLWKESAKRHHNRPNILEIENP
uniref:NB-ARC domain-containing protein n=1 Tax=Leersia perrieri TaxID=77586 RepID=A0A0D9XT54_9ORYZ